MPPQRIAYVGPVPPLRGGIAQHGGNLVQALRILGCRVDVFSWASQFPALLYPGQERDPEAAPLGGATFSLRWYSPPSWWSAGAAIRGADAVVFPWVTPFHAPAYRTVLRAARPRRAIVIVHNPIPHERRWFDAPATRWVLRHASGAIVHAASAEETLRRLLPNTPITTVPHPPNLTVPITPLPASPPIRLLFLGFVRRYKGLDIAIDAVSLLDRQGLDLRLTVAGQFWEPIEPYLKQARARGMEEKVDLRPGYVSDAELGELLKSHHLMVLPYRTATQSGIVPIAHAAGRPVVSTMVGGLPEVGTEGQTGALAPPGEARAFAEAIRRVIGDLPAMATRAGEVTTTWEDVASAVLDLAAPPPNG